MLSVSVAGAAGYSCPTYKKYTSCNAGYYLNGTTAGNSCSSCPSGCTCAGGTNAPVCCTNTCTSTPNSSSTSSGSESCGITNGAGTRSYTNTCNGYYTGGDNCTGSCTGCSSWGRTSTGTCYVSSCNSGYTNSNNSCVCTTPCTSVANRASTQSCTRSCSVSGGTCSYSGAYQICAGNYTNGDCSSAGASCSGCSSWGTCTGGTRYITCPAGTYWNGSACGSCPSGSYCPGFSSVAEGNLSNGYGLNSCSNKPANSEYVGSATANSCPWSCNAGYYGSSANGNTSCAACGSGNYCTGGTNRATCASTVKSGSPTPESIVSLSSGSWSDYEHAVSSSDCICNWYLSDSTRIQYLNQTTCYNGPSGNNYTHYDWCRTGYYASDPLNFNDWYNICTACTNAPANATYTSYSTPSSMYAVEDNCPWQCNANYYKSGSSCAACSSVSFTETGTDSESTTGGTRSRSKSRTCYRTTSPAGSTSASACTGSASCGDWSYGAWTYSCETGYTATASGCSCNTVCTSVANRSSTTSCTPSNSVANAYSVSCPAGTKTCNGNYTNSACSSAGASCTGCSSYGVCSTSCVAASCNDGYYLSSGACAGCPATYPNSANGTTGGIGACWKSCTRACTQQTCPANATCTHGSSSTSGTEYYGGSCSAAESTCDITITCNPGFYKNANGTCTACESGYYCPGDNSRKTCPPTASGSDNGRDEIGDCYISCTAKSISGGTTTVVNAHEYYSGSAYRACTYNVNCNAKYGAAGNKTANPTCTECAVGKYSAGGASACVACTNKIANSSYTSNAASNSCPWVCDSGYNLTSQNVCAQLCRAGITQLKMGNGITVPLYSAKQTDHALGVGYASQVCYGSLAAGNSQNAINVNFGGTTYHAIQ